MSLWLLSDGAFCNTASDIRCLIDDADVSVIAAPESADGMLSASRQEPLSVSPAAPSITSAQTTVPEGMMLAILFANAFAPLFDYYVLEANVKRRKMRYGK